MDISDRLLDRVQKLLNQANDPSIAGTPEADTFLDKAVQLMAQYGIERAMLDAVAPKPVKPMNKTVSFGAPYAKSKVRLYNAIVRAYRGQMIHIGKGIYHVFMMSTDEPNVEFLFTQLLLHGTTVLEHTDIPEWVNIKSFKVSWWHGFVSEISNRLEAANKKAEAEAEPGTALVLYDRSKMVMDEYTTAHPIRRKSYSYYSSDRGYNAGRDEGSRVNLGTPEVHNNRRAINGN